jgi:hypothetical protein
MGGSEMLGAPAIPTGAPVAYSHDARIGQFGAPIVRLGT